MRALPLVALAAALLLAAPAAAIGLMTSAGAGYHETRTPRGEQECLSPGAFVFTWGEGYRSLTVDGISACGTIHHVLPHCVEVELVAGTSCYDHDSAATFDSFFGTVWSFVGPSGREWASGVMAYAP